MISTGMGRGRVVQEKTPNMNIIKRETGGLFDHCVFLSGQIKIKKRNQKVE